MALRPPFQYYGAKGRLAPFLASLLPKHEVYCEPFAGSAAVFFAKKPAKIETINDINGDLVAFMRTLRDQPRALQRAIQLTPYAREEHKAAKLGDTTASDLERARRWWIQCSQSRSGEAGASWRRPTSRTRVNNPVGAKRAGAALRWHAARLREAFIENCDAMELIARMDSPQTAFYLDPPYLRSTRNAAGSGRYVREMDEDDEHVRLLDLLNSCQGTIVLSGYQSELYDKALAGWRRIDYRVRQTASDLRTHAVESIWVNR
ncbi:DNA adenine methylase [Planotetraspora phitsanulokensis]|uniref:DNA methyltransferase n=1 Tax=Planotetraspora phitsanulokensis TaxID=575192 RepID=A0A8J3UCZ6_9ACTN|nr:DNA adenine methylase [Planotetraspora phitsanulokensis]GII42953.1 DNA methyltransferase [Planotetraspora phitsanulokensis]